MLLIQKIISAPKKDRSQETKRAEIIKKSDDKS